MNTDKALRRALHSLPPTLFATYERILDRVNASNHDTQELVRRVLTWIVCSKRPLSTKELLEAVSISEGDEELDRDAMPDVEGILKWCSSLVRRTPDGDRLELAHFTVEEFLIAVNEEEPNSRYAKYRVSRKDQDLSLAKLCLTYLEFDDFGGEVWSGKADFDTCVETYPFFDYASIFWPDHAEDFHEDETLLELVRILFDPSKTSNFLHWSHFYSFSELADDSITLTSNAETLHFAATLSFYHVCEWLINDKHRKCDIDKLSNIGTPLCCAISRRLFKKGCNATTPVGHGSGSSVVILSSDDLLSQNRSRQRTVEFLLIAGAAIDNVRVHPDKDWSPLALALEFNFGWLTLLEKGAVLDETCLIMVEERMNDDPPTLAQNFLLSVLDHNLTDKIRSK